MSPVHFGQQIADSRTSNSTLVCDFFWSWQLRRQTDLKDQRVVGQSRIVQALTKWQHGHPERDTQCQRRPGEPELSVQDSDVRSTLLTSRGKRTVPSVVRRLVMNSPYRPSDFEGQLSGYCELCLNNRNGSNSPRIHWLVKHATSTTLSNNVESRCHQRPDEKGGASQRQGKSDPPKVAQRTLSSPGQQKPTGNIGSDLPDCFHLKPPVGFAVEPLAAS